LKQQKPHILIVDHDATMRMSLGMYLEEHGFKVSRADNTETALAEVTKSIPDLAILDVTFGQESGFMLCREIQKEADVPVIFLSGKSEDTERIIGLETGADDYVVKPFNPRELVARIRAILRRYQHTVTMKKTDHLMFGRWQLSVLHQELISENSDAIALTPIETKLLEIFVAHPGEVLSQPQLIDLMNLSHGKKVNRNIRDYVSRVRKKIEHDPSKPRLLRTCHGNGYMLDCDTNNNSSTHSSRAVS